MLAYALDRRPVGRSASPRTLAMILAGHAVLIGAVMTARMDLPDSFKPEPTTVTLIPDPVPPPPEPQPREQPRERPSILDHAQPLVPIPQPRPFPVDDDRVVVPPRGIGDSLVITPPLNPDPPRPALVRTAARFATPADDIRPPFPEAKRRLEEEASLRLALDVAPSGRVVAVTPIGAADPIFLDAARRHILRRWRYRPAMEGDSAVASRVTVTLKFELEE